MESKDSQVTLNVKDTDTPPLILNAPQNTYKILTVVKQMKFQDQILIQEFFCGKGFEQSLEFISQSTISYEFHVKLFIND